MRKIIAAVLAIVLIFGVVSCSGGNTPTDKAKEALNAMKAFDYKKLNEISTEDFMTEEDQKRIQDIGLEKLLKEMTSTLEYKILNEKIEGDTAEVEIELQTYSQDVLNEIMAPIAPFMLNPDADKAEVEKVTEEIIKKLKDGTYKREATNMTLQLKKVDDKWKVITQSLNSVV